MYESRSSLKKQLDPSATIASWEGGVCISIPKETYYQFHTEFSWHVPTSSQLSRIEKILLMKKHPNNVTHI